MKPKTHKNRYASPELRRETKKAYNKKIRRTKGSNWTVLKKTVDPEWIYC